MKSPSTRYGGKYYLVKELLPYIEGCEHKTFVEVFCGAAHITFAKEPSEVEVLNDIDSGLYTFYKVLRDDGDELARRLKLTPHSREEFCHCMNTWGDERDEIEKARKYWVSIMQSFGGIGVSFGTSVAVSRRGMGQMTSKYLRYIDERIPDAISRMRSVVLEKLDWRDCIKKYDKSRTLFYLDPPYVPEKRVAGGYDSDMSTQDHVDLVDLVNQSRGMFLISGYDNDIYRNLSGFEKVSLKKIATRADGDPQSKREYRTEMIWKNF